MFKVVLIGGGHVNCQVLKMLKRHAVEIAKAAGTSAGKADSPIQMTLVSENDKSYYSGMLPGSTAGIYDPSQIQVELKPLAKWWHANFIQKKVTKIMGDQNKIELADGSTVDYDILGINVGSKTKGTYGIPGVYDYSLTTRPIDDLIPKIQRKEQELSKEGIIPRLVVWGAGWAGVELSFGFKNRWQKFFNQGHIETTLLSGQGSILPDERIALRKAMERKLIEQKINVHTNWIVSEVYKDRVKWTDGREFKGNVIVWGTGAEPQAIIQDSDLEMSRGYFRVNEHLQSTSHPNIFCSRRLNYNQ